MPATSPLTRRQLYDLVWKTPIETLAPKFGLSGRGLSKLCERNAIPVPPRGYWARKQAGQKLPRPPLIEFERPNAGDPIILIARPPSLQRSDGAPPLANENPWRTFYAEQADLIGPLTVPERLTNPHAVIARWLARAEQDRKSWDGSTRPSAYAAPLERRRMRILSALYKTMERYGFRIEGGRHEFETNITNAGQRYDLALYERVTQKRRDLTAAERANSYSDAKYAFDKTATGLLTLRIKSYTPNGVPDRWDETAEAPLETKLHEVVAALVARAAELAERREQEAEAARQRRAREDEARRQEEARQHERARRDGLIARATDWRRATDIRAYIQAVEATLAPSAETEAWKAWALESANALDPLSAGDALATCLPRRVELVSA